MRFLWFLMAVVFIGFLLFAGFFGSALVGVLCFVVGYFAARQ